MDRETDEVDIARPLAGRVAWITGASRGLGRRLAEVFAAAGAELALSARSAAELHAVSESLAARGASVQVVVGSVTDPTAITQATSTITERWGHLDVLVNNAGISPSFRRSEELTEIEISEVLETNLIGSFACTRAALPLLEASAAGSVVNISSVHGSRAHERLIAYAASKGALEMVTRTLAVEWAPRGIRVNSLAPGYLETDLTAGLRQSSRWRDSLLSRIPMGRFGTPEEVAACAVFLASDAASYVTGATLCADGGWTAQ